MRTLGPNRYHRIARGKKTTNVSNKMFKLQGKKHAVNLTSCIRRSAVRAFLSSAAGSSSRYTLSAVAISLKGIPTAVLKPS